MLTYWIFWIVLHGQAIESTHYDTQQACKDALSIAAQGILDGRCGAMTGCIRVEKSKE